LQIRQAHARGTRETDRGRVFPPRFVRDECLHPSSAFSYSHTFRPGKLMPLSERFDISRAEMKGIWAKVIFVRILASLMLLSTSFPSSTAQAQPACAKNLE